MLDSAPIGTHAGNFFGEPHFSIPAEVRRKHMALFGGTGTGKSTLLANLAAADLDAGTGMTVADPHGGLYEELIANHIPRWRKNDVIVFEPKNRSHALGLNVLDCPRPEERGLVVSNVVSIFNTLWASSWGARLEDILRNALWALIEQPEPATLLELPRLLTNAAYRSHVLDHVENPAVLDFFANTFDRWPDSFREEAISPVLNKSRAFTTDPLMRAVIGETRTRFHFRWMMDKRKILLCNLAKGSIGDDNSRLLGSLIVLKEKLAALSRQDIPEVDRVPHVLYVEEAHNFIGNFESILAEARKYGLILTLATQGTESLTREAVYAIFSNCATVISFRVSGSDAVRISGEFGLMLPASQLQDLADYKMYIKTLGRSGDRSKEPGASPSGPHFVAAYPPFTRHGRHAHPESVIRVSQGRYMKPHPNGEKSGSRRKPDYQ